ncbi:MAG: ABC-2 transporter permease [Candidatus Gastranaerophilales bacterium]|nr:ABC-2 transporter permease [Candidatus Gastranaerophilales bacterium]
MKGLLLKELYSVKKKGILFGMFSLVFLVISYSQMGYIGGFFWFYPIFLWSMMPFMNMQEDEKSRWDIYCNALPYSRGQIVSAKYMVSVFYILGISLIMLLINLSVCSWEWSMIVFASGLILGLTSSTLIFPFVFALGAAKGMIAYYIVCILVGVVSVQAMIGAVEKMMTQIGAQHLLFVLAIFVLLFVLSWRLSVFLYRRRDL